MSKIPPRKRKSSASSLRGIAKRLGVPFKATKEHPRVIALYNELESKAPDGIVPPWEALDESVRKGIRRKAMDTDSVAKLVAKLDMLVALNEPRHGGPYLVAAAMECVNAMREAADLLRALPTNTAPEAQAPTKS